jgi:hypothetical protein
MLLCDNSEKSGRKGNAHMSAERMNPRGAPRGYHQKKKQRWPTRIILSLLSVGGLLGLWQFVAHEPAASAQSAPSFQDAEQQLQLGNSNDSSSGFFSSQDAPSAPNIISGMS